MYRRSALHDQYGGNRQGGIAPSAKVPYIFIFSGKSGKQYGYEDGWDNPNVFSYTGEGQVGDMQFTKGNLALKEHINRGKRVFLFEYFQKGYVRFVCELAFFDVDYFDTMDINGNNRLGIKFFFTKKGVYVPITPQQLQSQPLPEELVSAADLEGYRLPNTTERQGLVTSRVGQGAYRKRIIHRWEYECAVTKFSRVDVLIASHIVPWRKANDHERLDVHNGILLSPVYDALFDKHLISFENNGKIILSNSIEAQAYAQIGVTGKEQIDRLSEHNTYYLDQHRASLITI